MRINRHGFRGPDFESGRSRDRIRIVVLGDSVAFGFNVGENETFARQLERRLNRTESRRPVEVINAGVIGYTSWQGRKLYESEIRFWQPDLVLVLFGYNDHHSGRESDRQKYSRRVLDTVIEKLRWSSSLALGFRLRELALGPGLSSQPMPRVGLDEFEENLLAIREMARSDGAESLFLTVPLRPKIPLVENFRLARYSDGGVVATAWMRQLDIAVGLLGSAGELVSRHFLSSADLSPFTGDPENCDRSEFLSESYPELPVFKYLVALCRDAGGDHAGAMAAMDECRTLDGERFEMEAYNDRLRELARESRLELFDVASKFRDEGDSARWFLDVVHPTPAGHELIAGLVQKKIETLLVSRERSIPHRSPMNL